MTIDREGLRGRLARQLEALPLVLGGASEEALVRRPAPDKWAAREHLAHLARYHEVMMERLQRISREERPECAPYRAERDPDWPRWCETPASQALERLRDLRTALLAELDGCSEADLHRVGVHAKYGPMTVTEWLEFFLLHEAHHLYVIMGLRRVPSGA